MKIITTIGLAFFMALSVLPPAIFAHQVTEIYLTGVDLAAQGKFSEAKKIFQEITATDPLYERPKRCLKILADLESQKINHQTAGHLFKGLTYFYQDRFQEALVQGNLALQINPRYERAYSARGGVYFGLGKYDQAVADYNRALEIDPQYAGAYYNRGCAYLKTRQYERAMADFDRTLKIKPKYAGAFHNRGIAHFLQGQYLWALADCRRALEINPRLAEAHLIQAQVLEELGKEPEAVAAYKKFLQYASPTLSREIEYARKRLGFLEK